MCCISSQLPSLPLTLKNTTIVVILDNSKKNQEVNEQCELYCRYKVLILCPMYWYKMIVGTVAWHCPGLVKPGYGPKKQAFLQTRHFFLYFVSSSNKQTVFFYQFIVYWTRKHLTKLPAMISSMFFFNFTFLDFLNFCVFF